MAKLREGGTMNLPIEGGDVIERHAGGADSLDELTGGENVEQSQILDKALDSALEQVADFKSRMEAAVELSEQCAQEKDFLRCLLDECKKERDAMLEEGQMVADKQREQAESLQRMNSTMQVLQQSCNMWETISMQMTERAQHAEGQVEEQDSFILSLGEVVDKLEKSCLWWEALAGEMKNTADAAEGYSFDVEERIESMDDAYRSVWKDRLHWQKRAELAAAEKEEAVNGAKEQLASELSSQLIMTHDLQALAQRLMLEKDHLAKQLHMETQTVREVKDTCADLDSKLRDLRGQNQKLQDVSFQWQVMADLLSAKNIKVKKDLREIQTCIIDATEICSAVSIAHVAHEESVYILANRTQDLVKDNSELLRAEMAQTAAIQSLLKVVEGLEDSCLEWQTMTEEMSMENACCRQRLLETAKERDEALIDRDEARNDSARVQEQSKRELHDQYHDNASLSSAIHSMSGILQNLEHSCMSWDVLASELGAQSEFWQWRLRETEIERDAAHKLVLQAQEDRAQYEHDIQALAVLVETLESSCHTWEALVNDMLLSKEASERNHTLQMQEFCDSESKSNQEWSCILQRLEKDCLKWQTEAEAHAAQRDAAESELLLASIEIESLWTVLKAAHLKCQELVIIFC